MHLHLLFMHRHLLFMQDNCHKFLSVGRVNPPWVLGTRDNCIGCQECQALVLLTLFPVCFSGLYLPASNLKERGNGPHPRTKHTLTLKVIDFPSSYLSAVTQIQYRNSIIHLDLSTWPPWDLGTMGTDGDIKLNLRAMPYK